MSSHSPGRGSLSKSLGASSPTPKRSSTRLGRRPRRRATKTALENARHQIALLERSLASLEESERRARTRLADAQRRRAELTSAHERAIKEQPTPSRDSRRRRSSTPRREIAERAQGERRRPTRRLARVWTSRRASWRARRHSHAPSMNSRARRARDYWQLERRARSFLDLIEIDPGSERAVESRRCVGGGDGG